MAAFPNIPGMLLSLWRTIIAGIPSLIAKI